MASQVGGAITSAVGGFYQAKSTKANLKYQATMDGINAHLSEMQAQSALSQGNQQVAMLTERAGQVQGSQRAAQAANGIDLGEGSAAEVRASSDILKNIDAATISHNALLQAWGYRTQAVNSTNDALTKNASASGISPTMEASTSLLGSAGRVAQSWYMMNKSTNGTSIN